MLQKLTAEEYEQLRTKFAYTLKKDAWNDKVLDHRIATETAFQLMRIADSLESIAKDGVMVWRGS